MTKTTTTTLPLTIGLDLGYDLPLKADDWVFSCASVSGELAPLESVVAASGLPDCGAP